MRRSNTSIALALGGFILSAAAAQAGDALHEACLKDKKGTPAMCSCISDTMRASLKPEYHSIFMLMAVNKDDEAQMAMNRLGLMGIADFKMQLSSAGEMVARRCGSK